MLLRRERPLEHVTSGPALGCWMPWTLGQAHPAGVWQILRAKLPRTLTLQETMQGALGCWSAYIQYVKHQTLSPMVPCASPANGCMGYSEGRVLGVFLTLCRVCSFPLPLTLGFNPRLNLGKWSLRYCDPKLVGEFVGLRRPWAFLISSPPWGSVPTPRLYPSPRLRLGPLLHWSPHRKGEAMGCPVGGFRER